VQSVLAVGLSVAVFIASYLPLGAPLGRISFLWRYQLAHAGHGHLIGFAGRVSAEPPWWANFWFAGYGIGVLASIALFIAALVAVALVRQRPTWTLASALAAPVLFHTVLARVTLPFYWTMWLPAFLGLAAIGWTELVRVATTATARTRWRLAAAAFAVVLSAPIVWSVGTELHRTAVITPVGPIVIPAVLESNHVDGKIAIAGLYQTELEPYMESGRLLTTLPSAASAQAVIIGQPRCRTLVDLGIQALVATNLANGSLVPVYSDRLLVIYRAVRTLTIPSPAGIAAQPTRRVEDDC
jgi:hypothetical protein